MEIITDTKQKTISIIDNDAYITLETSEAIHLMNTIYNNIVLYSQVTERIKEYEKYRYLPKNASENKLFVNDIWRDFISCTKIQKPETDLLDKIIEERPYATYIN